MIIKINFSKLFIFSKSRISYFILFKDELNVLEDFKEIYCFDENARKNEIFWFSGTFVLVGGTRGSECYTALQGSRNSITTLARLDFRPIQQHTKSLHCNNTVVDSAKISVFSIRVKYTVHPVKLSSQSVINGFILRARM